MLKSTEKDGFFYTVTFIRQYENASVVNLTIDAEVFENQMEEMMHDQLYKQIDTLIVEDSVGTQYTCRNNGGGGFSGHVAYQYIITPPLRDNLTGVKLIFKEEKNRANQNHTGIEILIGENKNL